MRIGFQTKYSEERAEFAGKVGFQCLEIYVDPGSSSDVGRLAKEEREKIKELLAHNGVAVSCLGCYYINHLDPDENKRRENNEYFTHILKIAREFETNIVATNVFGDRRKAPRENLALYQKVFSSYAKIAESHGVKIAIENCPHVSRYPRSIGNIGYSPGMWELLFEAVPSSAIGLEYDPSHLVWQRIDYLRAIHDFRDRIYAVHAKDTEIIENKLYQEGILGGGWWRGRLPGFGVINWQRLIDTLYDIGYQGDLIIEHEDRAFSGERTDEGLRLGLKHLQLYVL